MSLTVENRAVNDRHPIHAWGERHARVATPNDAQTAGRIETIGARGCFVLLSAVSLAASTRPADGRGAAPERSPTGCGKPSALPLGDHRYFRKLKVGGRRYQLYVPRSYRPGHATALVLDFYFWRGSTAIEESLNGFERVAEKAGFVLARPEAAEGTGPSWSVYDGSDVAYARAVLADIRTAVCIDPARIYAAGMSQEGTSRCS